MQALSLNSFYVHDFVLHLYVQRKREYSWYSHVLVYSEKREPVQLYLCYGAVLASEIPKKSLETVAAAPEAPYSAVTY